MWAAEQWLPILPQRQALRAANTDVGVASGLAAHLVACCRRLLAADELLCPLNGSAQAVALPADPFPAKK